MYNSQEYEENMQWGEKYSNFFKILNFFRCAQLEHFLGCMKVDLEKEADDIDISGLSEMLPGLDDIAKRFFVMSAYANWDRTGIWDL